jgi:hypothetical protein
MPFNTNIIPGRPPILWSEVNDAFVKVNENFDILLATIGGGSGLTPIDFTSLDTDLTPTTDNLRSLGDTTHRWQSVFTSEHTTSNPLNGLWAGNAQIKGVGVVINLPENTTVGGDPLTGIGTSLIIDPDKTFFKEIQVNNELSVVATTFGDSVNFLSGSGVGLAVSSGADSITFSNTGVLSVAAGTGITTATVSGVATVTNAGVRSLQSTTALPSGRTTGAGINITGSVGDNLRITNAGVISISSGVGITVSADAATGDVTITNSAPAQNSFAQIQVDGDTINRLSADSTNDVLNINSGEGITLSKTVGTDTLTIAVNPVFDLRGSVFADDSTVMVDAVSGTLRGIFIGSVFTDNSTQIIDGNTATVYGNIEATTLRTSDSRVTLGQGAGSDGLQGLESVAIGFTAGGFTQGDYAVAIGSGAGNIGQGNRAIAIGATAGVDQGDYAISIGNGAGYPSAVSGSIAINASGFTLDAPAAGFYVNPIRNATGANGVVQYDSTTKEVSYSSTLGSVSGTFTGNIFTSLIDSADSSAITVTPATIFSSDVTVENDLDVTQRLRVRGSRVINLTELQAITAASTDFADFQTRIAALA